MSTRHYGTAKKKNGISTYMGMILVGFLVFSLPSFGDNTVTYDGEKSDYSGFDKYVTEWEGKAVEIVVPTQLDAQRRWVWLGFYTSPGRRFAKLMLERGFHVVHIKTGEKSWSPADTEVKNQFYPWVIKQYQLHKKPVLVGFSQGGISTYNWATRNPRSVAAIYADAPVCDFKSWPCGLGSSTKKSGLAEVLKKFDFKTEQEALEYKGNPIDMLAPLAELDVPLIHVIGDVDDVVPPAENTLIMEERYQALGGTIQVIHKPEGKHHPHGLKDYTPVLEFIFTKGKWD